MIDIPGITWKGESIDDVELLSKLPPELVRVLSDKNGFILHDGAFHFRGACLTPEWHSIRAAWSGPKAFHVLYEDVQTSDIPFAQDQVGDQFLLRDGIVLRLSSETGEIKHIEDSLEEFLKKLSTDIESYLNVGLDHKMQPGNLLQAYPPFCFQKSGKGSSLIALPSADVIAFHADLARQISDVPDGGQVQIKFKTPS